MVISNFENVSNDSGLDLKLREKCFIFFPTVNVIIFDYGHNIVYTNFNDKIYTVYTRLYKWGLNITKWFGFSADFPSFGEYCLVIYKIDITGPKIMPTAHVYCDED